MTEQNKKEFKLAISLAVILIFSAAVLTSIHLPNILGFSFYNDYSYFDEYEIYELDKSSVTEFLRDVRQTYGVELKDRYGYLAGSNSERYMREIEIGLGVFSPEFMQALVKKYDNYDARFIIMLEGHSDEFMGTAEWQSGGNLIITLHHDRRVFLDGISAGILAHEIAHSITYILDLYIGEIKGESKLGQDFESFNGRFPYVEDEYNEMWNGFLHKTTFANSYGMYDYYEDIATIFQYLIQRADDMDWRLSNKANEPLRNKTEYLRDVIYEYISDECWIIFEPLYSIRNSSLYNDNYKITA